MESFQVKQEILEHSRSERRKNPQPEATNSKEVPVIDLSSSSGSDSDDHDDSSSSSSSEEGDVNGKRSRDSGRGERSVSKKRKKLDELGVVLPVGLLEPLHPKEAVSRGLLASPPADAVVPRSQVMPNGNVNRSELAVVGNCKQFWKAGNYDGAQSLDWDPTADGMDHVRVHPKFLHSNATSHKWVLGAFAELLDNAMDEVCNGATHVNIDVLENKKDRSKMLLIEDNGGGMHPDKMRQCMSLGYSLKSKVASTIGQYGNGFKTSTMRLGADVIVFSRCSGNHEKRPTQSIGLLSYTFLRSTGKEDIVVPMLDYERQGEGWNKILRSSASDWSRNVEAIVQWSPFSCETDLLQQFNHMKDQGTLIIIYNLWEDDQGLLELDFNTDLHDIQIRGVNRDEKKIEMAKQFPNSRHFLTYRHSLRSYASILYLRIPPGFRIILRGKDVEHHNVVNDMMMTQEVTYRPQTGDSGIPKDSNMVADVTIGFVKDAKAHIDVQGFNVYHKNRLIKPFWRVWNAAASDGRGVIGVLEANFVEPAHDKQGFERTIVLSRLETRLVQMQKLYWSTNCDKIGYAPRHNRKSIGDKVSSPDYLAPASPQSRRYSTLSNGNAPVSASDKVRSFSNQKQSEKVIEKHHKTLEKSHGNGHLYSKAQNKRHATRKWPSSLELLSPFPQEVSDDNGQTGIHDRQANGTREGNDVSGNERHPSYSDSQTLDQLKEENRRLRERLKKKEKVILGDLLNDLQYQRDRCKSLEAQLQEATKKIEDLNKEQESLIDIFSEERERRNIEEENLRKKLKDASNTIQELLNKVRMLKKMKTPNGK